LYAATQSLYEKDKIFTLEYISTADGLKTSYRSSIDQHRRSNAALKRKTRQEKVPDDKECSFGPPDKKQHFALDKKKLGKKKECNKSNGTENSEVEVWYDDGNWYRGWLSSFNFITGS